MNNENSAEGGAPKYVLTALIAFLIGFGSAWLYLNQGDTSRQETGKNIKEESAANNSANSSGDGGVTLLLDKNAIIVNDQEAGARVSVAKVVLEKGGWAVVHEDDGTGRPGKILGAQLFDAGTWSGEVTLLRGTEAGRVYYAMLHHDNGDRAFDPKIDTPILGSNNQPIMTTFKTSSVVGGDDEGGGVSI
jgi:hypothetical protein